VEDITFDGEVVIVTGGGRGLGQAYCLELARRGALVVVNDIEAQLADEVVNTIAEAGGTAVASPISVATPEGGEAVVRQAVDRYGTVDAVINNAGILRNNYFEDLTLEQIDAVVDVNLRGAFFVTQPAWRVMKRNGYGRVVLTSSAAGLFSRPGSVNYSAAKAGLYGMARALSFEGADHGIKVNVLLPRAATTITADDPVPGMSDAHYSDELKAALAPRRSPHSTAALACWLASRACTVSGEAYSSAFGRYARVFVGLTQGWLADDADGITVEDVMKNIDTIRDTGEYTIPASNFAEVEQVAAMIGVDLDTRNGS
jgi:NAD(P)-dependent dehydrogenase (short-subunit alcohol dehydrogenase family)